MPAGGIPTRACRSTHPSDWLKVPKSETHPRRGLSEDGLTRVTTTLEESSLETLISDPQESSWLSIRTCRRDSAAHATLECICDLGISADRVFQQIRQTVVFQIQTGVRDEEVQPVLHFPPVGRAVAGVVEVLLGGNLTIFLGDCIDPPILKGVAPSLAKLRVLMRGSRKCHVVAEIGYSFKPPAAGVATRPRSTARPPRWWAPGRW